MLEEIFEEQRRRILKEFSLDSEDSALSRLVRKVRETNGDLTSDIKAQVNAPIGEFSLDEPDSALSRLVWKVEAAQKLIGDSLTLDDETSPLSRLKRELQSTIDGLVENNTKFQAEVRETFAKHQAHRDAAAKSTHYVKAAYSVARALVIRETHESAESEAAVAAIEKATITIEKQLEHLGQIKTWADTVKNNGEKISERAGKLQEALAEQVETPNGQIKALKSTGTQA